MLTVTTVPAPPTETRNPFYPGNRPPLLPNPLIKLPVGAVRAKGWLEHQLHLMEEGMTGRLYEVSRFLNPTNGWLDSGNKDPHQGWEEQPYWLRGYYDLAVLTGNDKLLADAKRWIEAVLQSQDRDGCFGQPAQRNVTGENGQRVTDLWPHMVMLDAVIHHYEHTRDERVIPFMTRFFQYCRDLSDDLFIAPLKAGFGNWKPNVQQMRAGDMIPHLHWLYNQTEEPWLLDLATRFFHRISPPVNEFLDIHIVNFTQRFSYPGLYYGQTGRPSDLQASEYWYGQHMGTWGQQARGIFGADELVRSGKTDPRQAFETCGFVEFCKSFYMLARLTGDPMYADRCEDLMFNHFPAAQTPDLKGLHYLTASNMPQLDASGDHDFQNRGRQIDYSPYLYRCCQHNVAMGWPWFVQNLWQATVDRGLAAFIYAASEVTARVGEEGRDVTLSCESDYPFRESLSIRVRCEEPAEFPIYFRVPGWCEKFTASVNGATVAAQLKPRMFLRLIKRWETGDRIDIRMPMRLSLTTWPRTGSVTVDRGPLSYSVKIEEKWQRYTGGKNSEEWPEWEVFPASPWNYGLVLDEKDPCKSMKVIEKREVPPQPWTCQAAPTEIRVPAKKIPGWELGEDQTVAELQASPIRSREPEEEIAMIPLGCARLRMACLPRIGEGGDAREWKRRKSEGE